MYNYHSRPHTRTVSTNYQCCNFMVSLKIAHRLYQGWKSSTSAKRRAAQQILWLSNKCLFYHFYLSFLDLAVWEVWCFEDLEKKWMSDSVKQLMNDKVVCGTAPATPGPLIRDIFFGGYFKICLLVQQKNQKMLLKLIFLWDISETLS